MKRLLLLGSLALSAVVLMTACGGTTNVSVNSNANRNSNSNSGSTMGNAANSVSNGVSTAVNTVANTVSTTPSPDSFMQEAAQGGMAEVELGKLAQQKAKDPEVKKFGAMMVADHTKANTELKELAGKKNVSLPTDLGSHKSDHDKLAGMSGADFDREYVDAMVEDHETDVSNFEKFAQSGTDPDVKAFAAKTLPTLKKHLEAIKGIQAKMNNSGGSNANANTTKK